MSTEPSYKLSFWIDPDPDPDPDLCASMRELAIRLKMRPPGVRYCAEREGAIARDNGYELMA
jgi:hypothetical protein